MTTGPDDAPFWERKRLEEMTDGEWESLCDGCGRCCLEKAKSDDSPDLYFLDVGCELLDPLTAGCSDYEHRLARVPGCFKLTPAHMPSIDWLPDTCGYTRVFQGRKLEWWHPLVSGDPSTVHSAHVSVRGKVKATDKQVGEGEWEDHVVRWPMRLPKAARRK